MRVTTRLISSLFSMNESVVSRAAPMPPNGVFDLADFPWAEQLQSQWRTIRSELDAILDQGVVFPAETDAWRVEHDDLPDEYQPLEGAGPLTGSWRAYVLHAPGARIPSTSRRLPATSALLDQVPGLNGAQFSFFGPHSHLPMHRAPNKGSLRYLLALKVPGPPGSCRMRVGDEVVDWSEGKAVLFDHATVHEAWNDSDGERILLFLEVVTPLPAPAAWLNQFTQTVFRWFPGPRGARKRIDALDRALND